MPLLVTSDFPPPKEDKEFEEIVRDIFAAHWNDPNTRIFGRSGQGQSGVDVYGQPNQLRSWFGIQCKLRKTGQLTRKDLEREIEMARSFHQTLHTFIFATTLSRDTKLQKIVEELNGTETQNGSFRVQIRFWEDICSLLAENINIARKYYPQYFKGRTLSETTIHQPLSEHPSDITAYSPMLVGLVVDLSRSMIQVLKKNTGFRDNDLKEAIGLVVEKAVSFCKTPEADEILPKFALFVYGYGFSDLRKRVNNVINRLLGTHIQGELKSLIPADPVRDLFAEVATKQSLPFTPDILTLNQYWDFYRKSVEYQFLDMGLGPSNFYESLCQVHDRLCKELERPYFKHPLVIFISDGQMDSAEHTDIARMTTQIQELGTQVMHCYVSATDITEPKIFYPEPDNNWPKEAQTLFNLSSTFNDTNPLLNNIAQEAREKGWQVPERARMFMQLNHSELLEELVEILLSSLKD